MAFILEILVGLLLGLTAQYLFWRVTGLTLSPVLFRGIDRVVSRVGKAIRFQYYWRVKGHTPPAMGTSHYVAPLPPRQLVEEPLSRFDSMVSDLTPPDIVESPLHRSRLEPEGHWGENIDGRRRWVRDPK